MGQVGPYQRLGIQSPDPTSVMDLSAHPFGALAPRSARSIYDLYWLVHCEGPGAMGLSSSVSNGHFNRNIHGHPIFRLALFRNEYPSVF